MEERTGRRSFLKACTALGLSTSAVGLTTATEERQTTVASLETGNYDTLDAVEIEPLGDGSYRVFMGGTVEPGTAGRGYSLNFDDKPKRKDASATSDAASVEAIPTAKLPTPAHKARAHQSNTGGETTTGSSTTSSDGVSAFGGDSGGDNESDYEGGVWILSEDPPDLDLCKTDHWMDWDSYGDYDARGSWKTWEYYTPPSDWNHNRDGFSGVDTEPAAESKYEVDYINWNWQWNHNKTEAFHRTYLTGYDDGSMDWGTTQWHSGEDSGLLRSDVGHYSNGNV